MSKQRYKTRISLPHFSEIITTVFHFSVLEKAAYADMINTTIDQKGISLSEKELLNLNRGGRMWEEGSLS